MARPSSLTQKQWCEIERRRAKGESNRSLAKEFGISASMIQARFGSQQKKIAAVATQMLAAEEAFSALPITAQINTQNLLNELRAVSLHLASAARYGAATSHRLSAIANAQIDSLDENMNNDKTAKSNERVLRNVAMFTQTANESAKIGLNLLAANKELGAKALEDTQALENTAVPVDPIEASKVYQRLISGA